MKLTYLPALLLLASCTAPNWQAFAVDKHVTVLLPKQPKLVDFKGARFPSAATEKTANSASVRVFSTTDNSCTYGIMVNDSALPAHLEQSFVRDSFYNRGIQHVLRREHSTLLARSSFATPAGEGAEVKFRLASAPDSKGAVQYLRSVLVGRASYLFMFTSRSDQDTAGNAQRRRFFDSITVKP